MAPMPLSQMEKLMPLPEMPAPQEEDRTKDPVASLAGQIRYLQQFDRGALARLRRFHPAQEAAAILFDAERLLHKAGVQAQGEARARWELVLHCLAIAQGRHASGAQASAGEVLARVGMSEPRLRQLIEADPELLSDLMPRVARRIAAEGATLDWRPLADLLLYAGTQHEDRADRARRKLVEGFLRGDSRHGSAREAAPEA